MWNRGWRKQQSERIAALEEAVEGQKRRAKLLTTEWEDTLDRMNRVMGRLNARIRKSAEKSDAEDAPESTTVGPQRVELPQGTHDQLETMRKRHGLLPG